MSARVGVGLIVVAIALLITASAGASVASVERPLSVEVVDGDEAGVAVEAVEAELLDNAGSETAAERADENATDAAPPLGERELLVVTNQLGEEITVTEIEVPDGIDQEDASGWVGTEIETGENATLEGTVDCSELEPVPEVSVELSGSDVTISQTVELAVTCPSESV
ncbi:hypothetical protein [Natronococcus occultus]|uniref:Uncharacterized protein n=1 Tax=Natronococcus occultus SP4 TaxID=694430 RepID=L0JWK9_9EURY|nr:hypothetical protein [Natronococcus occultus]AGB36489.1 hypothetical protein Natoc_0629 [Natronococcus occultus SP4]